MFPQLRSLSLISIITQSRLYGEMLSQERGSHSQPSQHMRKKRDPFARANTAIQYSGLKVLSGYGMPKTTNRDYEIDCCLCSPLFPWSPCPHCPPVSPVALVPLFALFPCTSASPCSLLFHPFPCSPCLTCSPLFPFVPPVTFFS